MEIKRSKTFQVKSIKTPDELSHFGARSAVLRSAYTDCCDAVTFGNVDLQGRVLLILNHVSDIGSPVITKFT